MKLKLSLFSLILLSSSAFATDPNAGVDAVAFSTSCVRNNACIVTTSHSATYHNYTNTQKVVFVSYKICPQNELCLEDKYRIVVNHGTWHDGKRMQLMAKYHYMGDFYLEAITTLYDEHHNVLNTIKGRGKILVHG